MTIDSSANSIANSDSNWSGDAATYRFSEMLTLSQDQILTFSFDFVRSASNTVQSITMVGTTQALVIGHGNYANNTDLHVGLSTNVANATSGAGAHGYVFEGTANQGFIASVDAGSTLTGGMIVGSNSISGSVAWNGSEYALTLTSSSAEGSLTYNLGTTFNVRDIVFTFDGPNATTLSNLKLNIVPEPATATLSLLALAGLAARRRRK